MRPKYAAAVRDLESLHAMFKGRVAMDPQSLDHTAQQLALLVAHAKQAGVFSDLGPEGIKETQQLSVMTHDLASRARGLRRMLDQGALPVFRRLLKESGCLDSARKALRESLAVTRAMAEVWKAYAASEAVFSKQLSQQAPDQYQLFMQAQRAEGA